MLHFHVRSPFFAGNTQILLSSIKFPLALVIDFNVPILLGPLASF
jgi:hypothetical protein